MKLADLQKGLNTPGVANSQNDPPPEWLDMEKFKRGQTFCVKHIGAVSVSFDFMGSNLSSRMERLLDVGVFNNRNPLTRSLRISSHLMNWYHGDVWGGLKDDAFKSMRRTRLMHKMVGEKMNKAHPAEHLHLSQYDMALVQSISITGVITDPDKYGIKCSKDEQEDYIHYWRGLGYLLGLEDKYNVCNDGT
jgi:hypothetical protein